MNCPIFKKEKNTKIQLQKKENMALELKPFILFQQKYKT